MEDNIAIAKYLVKFGAAYILGCIVLVLLTIVFDLENNSGASIGILFGATIYSAGTFVRDNKRVPSKKEKSKMIWLSFVISVVSSLVFTAAVLLWLEGMQGLAGFAQLIGQAPMGLVAGSLIVASLVSLAVLSFGYGHIAKKQFEGLKKKGIV